MFDLLKICFCLEKKEAEGQTFHLPNVYFEFRKHCRSKVLKTEKGQKDFRCPENA